MTAIGNSTIKITNPTLVLHDPSDGNVVTATRSDTGGLININVGTVTDNADLQALLDAVAVQLAQQNAVADALAQVVFSGTATSDHGTSTALLHVFKYVANNDGLTASYMLTPSPVDGQFFNINLGIVAGTAQSDIDAFASSASALLQTASDTAAQTARAAADATVGISDLTGTGSASVTLP